MSVFGELGGGGGGGGGKINAQSVYLVNAMMSSLLVATFDLHGKLMTPLTCLIGWCI